MQPFIEEEFNEYGYIGRMNGVVARTAIDDANDVGQRLSDNPTLGPNPFEVERTTNAMGITTRVTWHNDRFTIMLDEENPDPEEDYGFELIVEGGPAEDIPSAVEVIKDILANPPPQGARRRRKTKKTKKRKSTKRRRSLRA